jgi:hypothetical protein
MNQGNPPEIKSLPDATTAARPVVTATAPARQLSDLPKDELEHLAEDFGLDPSDYKTRQHLVAAVHERRQLIATLDREAMLDVVKWGRRAVPLNATKEQLALEISRIRSMRFAGLSHRGLVVLAHLRGVRVEGNEQVPELVRKLKRQEGFFAKLNRKRRAFIGSLVSNMIGDSGGDDQYQFLPPQNSGSAAQAGRMASIKEEIEEQGLIGGLAGRIKKSADSYLNQKLDEIEARIDRKLDEIDRRLAEWRDKEVANRIRILKITLWASIIVAGVSLIYAYLKAYIL